MKAPLYSKQGNKKKEVVLNPDIYAVRVNQRLLELVHKAFAANLRHGTVNTKVRKEVRGGGKKPWKQKGTGRARAGSSRSPIWRGGGIVFGPHPRNYNVHLSQTTKERALVSALSLRGGQKSLVLLEDTQLETAKTKEWIEIFKSLPLQGKRTLCVVKEIDSNIKRASGNAERMVEVKSAKEFNAYHVLQKEKIVISQDALPLIEERLLTEKETAEAGKKEAK